MSKLLKDVAYNLKPCPFCGGKTEVADLGELYMVKCLNGCDTSAYVSPYPERAIKKWNNYCTELRKKEDMTEDNIYDEDEILKSCPFCGQHPVVSYNGSLYSVSCDNARCEAEICLHKPDYDEVIKAWNNQISKSSDDVDIETGLKPCPLCGSKAQLKYRLALNACTYTVDCSNRECMTYLKDDFKTKDKAITTWNTRVKEEKENDLYSPHVSINQEEDLEPHFTPSPWKADTELACMVTACDDQMQIADIRGWGHLTGVGGLGLPDEEADKIMCANTLLIASAPDMYQELCKAKNLLKRLVGGNTAEADDLDIVEEINSINKILRKATTGD